MRHRGAAIAALRPWEPQRSAAFRRVNSIDRFRPARCPPNALHGALYAGKGALGGVTGAESSLFSPRRDRKPAGVSDIRPRVSLVLRSLLPYPNSCQGTSPHQQGWDTKMAMLSFCGIDVSKDRLDVVVLPEGWFFSVSNDTAGWAELVVRLRPLAVSAIGLEPSGDTGLTPRILNVGTVAHQPAHFGNFPRRICRGNRAARRQVGKLPPPEAEKRVGTNQERVGPLAHKSCEGRIDLVAGAGVEDLDLQSNGARSRFHVSQHPLRIGGG